MNLKRRSFITGGAMFAATAALPANAANNKNKTIELPKATDARAEEAAKKLVLGQPFLQAAAETSMGIAWSVNVIANGWVEYSENPDLANAKKVICGGFGVTGFDDRVIQVRLTNLKPATKYYYRIGAQHVDYVDNYRRFLLDTAQGDIHSFTTLGEKTASHFAVINDTHAQWKSFAMVTEKVTALAPAVTVWNGDASNLTEKRETGVQIFLEPQIPHPDFAANIPLLWNNGNHDFRGYWNRNLECFMMTRLPSERSPRDWELTRNWAVRVGDIAMIGLDTGEDKPDRHPQFAGLVNCEPYRDAQTQWLAEQFQRPEIKSAPFVVAFCHIPLFDKRPDANGGGVLEGFADYQKQCADAWGPIFNANSVQVVVAAHMHRYRYDAASGERKWAQIVGGGPECGIAGHGKNVRPDEGHFPTVIEGKVENGELKIVVHNTFRNTIAATHSFKSRF